ncbi:MAG: TetR/AcrR family transcriptional regulator [Nocardioides sp.]|uniref:TetR/AcrR family transcriptional regulator n=1 Tax=Nocardioides sp. TaxID=35761 RepID=UPI00238517FB|nr:TetR/AcrR family transcriptional regulator [Nocardioides sp.]MDE0775572.1 TetR/AcrR family transcriptional regulator [Nocardioides sp.]
MSSQVFRTPRQGLRSRQAETLTKLLVAGEEELRSVGHEALTVRTVAARAGVSPATAYTYLASKNHLFAELFLGYLAEDAEHEASGADAVDRVRSVTRQMAHRLAAAPELAAAVTPALLSSDPDVERLRLRIGAEFVRRFTGALAGDGDDELVEALTLAFSGALLQAGMGLLTYTEMGDRLDTVVATILRGNV